jgi:hypothetical protein
MTVNAQGVFMARAVPLALGELDSGSIVSLMTDNGDAYQNDGDAPGSLVALAGTPGGSRWTLTRAARDRGR